MPRPKRTIRPTYLNLAIPETLRCRLDLLLYSTLEGRVPHGAYSTYICDLIQADLGRRAATANQAGEGESLARNAVVSTPAVDIPPPADSASEEAI